jgi:hypothetical protein
MNDYDFGMNDEQIKLAKAAAKLAQKQAAFGGRSPRRRRNSE